MPFHKDPVSFTEARALLWLTILWGGSREVWSEPIALWSGQTSCYPAGGSLDCILTKVRVGVCHRLLLLC